jgi:hypothetical protein
MNKQELLQAIAKSVSSKHPWRISQENYQRFFRELPLDFLEERIHYDNLLKKTSQFKLCHLVLSSVKIEIKLSLDELIAWKLSLDKWEDARLHNILLGDIKTILKDYEAK